MDLHTFGYYFNKVILPLLLVVGSVLFLFVGILNIKGFLEKSRLGQTKLPNNLTFSAANYSVGGGDYQLTDPKIVQNLPSKVSTFKATFGLTQTELNLLAKKLELTVAPVKKDHIIFYRFGANLLSYDSSLNLLTYNKSQEIKSASIGFGESDINMAKSYLTDILPANLKFVGVTYTTSGVHSVTVTAKEAQLAIYHFQPVVEGQVVAEESLVILANNKELVGLDVHPFKLVGKEADYLAKTKTEINQELISGQFFLKYKRETSELSGKIINGAVFSKLNLVYVSQPKQSLLQPVYLLSGTTRIANTGVDVEGIFAAIRGVGVNK